MTNLPIQSDYWDLTERQRSQMTEEQVRNCEAYELMRAGVVRADPPEPLGQKPPLTPTTYYRVRHDWSRWSSTGLGIVFTNPDQAREFIDSDPYIYNSHHIDGSDFDCVGKLSEHNPSVEMFEGVPQLLADEHRAELEKFGSAKTKHKQETQAYEAQLRKERDAIQGLWKDWYQCCETGRELQRVLDTYAEYQALAGNDELAATFLAKAFTPAQIDQASEWFEVDLPKPAPQPEAATEEPEPCEAF